tara:strand:+ start:226 stop:393 length:168 start_codon:yes stop_codon:yes gene_type:complete
MSTVVILPATGVNPQKAEVVITVELTESRELGTDFFTSRKTGQEKAHTAGCPDRT